MILISNQSAVGRGLLRDVDLEDITQRMWKALELDGAQLSAAYFCPHRPDEKCNCRKPQPGLLKQAAADFGIDLARSVLIGDSDADVKGAQAVGCHPVLFGPGHTACSDSLQWMKEVPMAHTAKDLFHVTVAILQKANPAPLSADIVSHRIS